jgi:hypothetical protein
MDSFEFDEVEVEVSDHSLEDAYQHKYRRSLSLWRKIMK